MSEEYTIEQLLEIQSAATKKVLVEEPIKALEQLRELMRQFDEAAGHLFGRIKTRHAKDGAILITLESSPVIVLIKQELLWKCEAAMDLRYPGFVHFKGHYVLEQDAVGFVAQFCMKVI